MLGVHAARPLARVFGDGGHPTTRLAAAALDGELARRPGPARVLDAGSGTGILAARAAARGARVLAIDGSREAARLTAARAPRTMTLCADLERIELAARFDVVVANLPDPIIFRLAARLAGWLADGGCLLATGVPLCRASALAARLEAAGLSLGPPRALGGWALVGGTAA